MSDAPATSPTPETPHPQPRPATKAVPVAYVLVPHGATANTLVTEFARYLGIPTTGRMTTTQITEAVCHTYTQAGARLVMIDEIHRLNPRTTTGAEAADLLKDLTERLAATLVYAGIDVTSTALFTGVRGAQLAARATLIGCGPLPARTGNRYPFTDLICDIENALDGTEHITKTSLEAIRLDHHAETHHRPKPCHRPAHMGLTSKNTPAPFRPPDGTINEHTTSQPNHNTPGQNPPLTSTNTSPKRQYWAQRSRGSQTPNGFTSEPS